MSSLLAGIIFGLLLLFTSPGCGLLQDYRLTTTACEDVIKNCTAPGLFCESCTRLTLCIKNDSGFNKTFVDTCTKPEKCLSNACTTAADPFCDGLACLPFICNDIGVFPDPFDCKKHVYCVKETATSFKAYSVDCDEGYGYNSSTKVCDLKLTDNNCPTQYPIDLCTEAGQTQALVDNPSIYYVCKIYNTSNQYLYPFLYICPHGEVYEDATCQEDSLTTVTTTSTITTSPSTTTVI